MNSPIRFVLLIFFAKINDISLAFSLVFWARYGTDHGRITREAMAKALPQMWHWFWANQNWVEFVENVLHSLSAIKHVACGVCGGFFLKKSGKWKESFFLAGYPWRDQGEQVTGTPDIAMFMKTGGFIG